MKKHISHYLMILLLMTTFGCSSAERILYTENNNSGHLCLTHYTSLMPTLGPCGFSRAIDSYDITTPRISGKIASNELSIFSISDTVKYQYIGYIEFRDKDKVYVELYKVHAGLKTQLTINGIHKIKIKEDKI